MITMAETTVERPTLAITFQRAFAAPRERVDGA
jgi:hypothetical protein